MADGLITGILQPFRPGLLWFSKEGGSRHIIREDSCQVLGIVPGTMPVYRKHLGKVSSSPSSNSIGQELSFENGQKEGDGRKL